MFAIAVIVLLSLKISFVEVYKQFYGQVKIIGLLIALLTFGMVGTSGGYYLLITKLGMDIPFKTISKGKEEIKKEGFKILVKTDPESIRKGKELDESKCYFCHDAYSTKTFVGPGHKGIMKNPLLPISKRPSTPENIVHQLKDSYKNMPSFSYLTNDEILNIIAFLNTL